jgi:diguanylate cyclase (GGDEF)-like protein
MKISILLELLGRHYEDKLIHASVHADRDAVYRARIFVFILLVALPIEVVLTGFLSWWAPADLPALLPVNILSIILMCAFVYLLKWHGMVNLCCIAGVVLALSAITFTIAISGGPYHSPARQLLFLPCLMSFLFGGVRLGATTLVICLIILVSMMTAQISGHEFSQLSSATLRLPGNVTILTVNFLIASVLAFSYEYISMSLRRERDLEYQKFVDLARKDPLTGLANRSIFDEALHSRIELYERMPSKPCFTLCYLDLDKFKPINDTFGHDTGDDVLSVVSNRLLSALRGADFIGRHGGDEFMILFDGVNSDDSINALGARLLQLIRTPIATRVGELGVDASLGFAVYPQHGRDATSLTNATDAAMYEAKRSRAGFCIHQPRPAS